MAGTNTATELIDKCVGSRIWVVMKGDKGTLEFQIGQRLAVAYTNMGVRVRGYAVRLR